MPNEVKRTICDIVIIGLIKFYTSKAFSQLLYSLSLGMPATHPLWDVDKIIQISTSYMITFCTMCLTKIALEKPNMGCGSVEKLFIRNFFNFVSHFRCLYRVKWDDLQMSSTQIFIILFSLENLFPFFTFSMSKSYSMDVKCYCYLVRESTSSTHI